MEFVLGLVSALIVVLVTVVVDLVLRRRRVQVLVHQAFIRPDINVTPPVTGFGAAPDSDEYVGTARDVQVFVKIVNRSRGEIEITHIWFATTPPQHLLNEPLPARLRPEETYETSIPAADLPQLDGIERLARVKLSARRRPVRSAPNRNLPPFGFMAGKGSR